VLAEIEDEAGREHIPYLAYCRILKPLMDFGLLEEREDGAELGDG